MKKSDNFEKGHSGERNPLSIQNIDRGMSVCTELWDCTGHGCSPQIAVHVSIQSRL